VPRYTRTAIDLLSVFGPGFLLPSRSPRLYRANRGTSIGAYRALLALKDALEATSYRNANRPTLVLVDPRDEVVSSRTLARLIRQHRLDRWTLAPVDNHVARSRFGFRHLMVDEEAMGPELWASQATLVGRHLNLPDASDATRAGRVSDGLDHRV
jgi:hypothetical protein